MTSNILTQELLKEEISYNAETGVFKWNKTGHGRRLDLTAGYITISCGKKYLIICMKYNNYFAHRLAWLYVYGIFTKYEIDHIDGNGLNNKLSNLRDVKRHENKKNVRLQSNNKSGCSGVHYLKEFDKWVSYIKTNNKRAHLGYFKNKNDAIIARKMEEYNRGFHANHGIDRPL